MNRQEARKEIDELMAQAVELVGHTNTEIRKQFQEFSDKIEVAGENLWHSWPNSARYFSIAMTLFALVGWGFAIWQS